MSPDHGTPPVHHAKVTESESPPPPAASLRPGDGSALWPGIEPAALAEARQRIAETTRAVLRGDSPAPRFEAPAPPVRQALGVAAYVSGVGPLLGHWLEHGQLRADPEAARVFAVHLEQGRRRAERLELHLTQLLEILVAAGVTPTLLKGSDTAYRFFPKPALAPAPTSTCW